MKKVIIVHCWDGNSEYCWYPWVKDELEKQGFVVEVPNMPDTSAPKLDKWLPKLQEIVGQPDEDTYLVGHSAGSVTIIRYLESLSPGERIGGAVLVAGFTDNLGYKELENFFVTPIQFEKIKQHCTNFFVIASDNDPFVPLKHADILKEKLDAKVIIKHGMKHFSGAVDDEESCTELPDVVSGIIEISQQSGGNL